MPTWSKQDLAIYNLKRTPPTVRQAAVDAKSHKELLEQVVQWLHMKGVLAVVTSRQDKPTTQAKGVADALCCVNGRGLALEIKVGADSIRPEQRAWLADAAADGWTVAVVRSLPDAIAAYQQAAGS